MLQSGVIEILGKIGWFSMGFTWRFRLHLINRVAQNRGSYPGINVMFNVTERYKIKGWEKKGTGGKAKRQEWRKVAPLAGDVGSGAIIVANIDISETFSLKGCRAVSREQGLDMV